ncbi:Aldehyde/histidinol dehydrogenase [Tricladium varicosporioides]|nr:Aldehyde/histidinol dehydrogenase [Hymenoscyphus varicosporioides]
MAPQHLMRAWHHREAGNCWTYETKCLEAQQPFHDSTGSRIIPTTPDEVSCINPKAQQKNSLSEPHNLANTRLSASCLIINVKSANKMVSDKMNFIPLIINGIDVRLPNGSCTFIPESFTISASPGTNVTAQGADTASCHIAVDSCAQAFHTWRHTSTIKRRALFLHLAQILRNRGDEVRAIIENETHATPLWSSINLEESILLIEETAALVTSFNLTGSIPPSQDSETHSLIILEPLGVIIGIAPWNSPLLLGRHNEGRSIAKSRVYNTVCMSTDTVLIASSIFVEFRQALLSIVQNRNSAPEITPLITTKAATRVRSLVIDAASKGAVIHTVSGSYTAPSTKTLEQMLGSSATVPITIIEGLDRSMDIFVQESFGPILSVMSVGSANEAVEIVNQCRYGLSSAIHTKNHYQALLLAKKMKVSATHINGCTVHDESTLPHGGHGDSGWGRFGGHWGMQEFVHTKTIIMNK